MLKVPITVNNAFQIWVQRLFHNVTVKKSALDGKSGQYTSGHSWQLPLNSNALPET
jgi:hypothetical protein